MTRPLRLLSRKPWYFRLAQAWINSGLRGGYRWLAWLKRRGRLGVCAPFELGDNTVLLPLDTIGATDPALFDYYEQHALDAVARAAKRFATAPVLIDCGADVGVYTRLLLHRGLRPASIVAIEPNPRTFAVLETNLAGLPYPTICFNGAVSAECGQGRLQTPDYDPDQDRAAFVSVETEGEVIVETLDHLLAATEHTRVEEPRALVMKVDVEGAELDVLRGAQQILREATEFVVQFEAHPGVAERSAIDPIKCLELLVAAGAEHWLCSVESTGQVFTEISPVRPFFEQMDRAHIYDVVASTAPLGPTRVDRVSSGSGLQRSRSNTGEP